VKATKNETQKMEIALSTTYLIICLEEISN